MSAGILFLFFSLTAGSAGADASRESQLVPAAPMPSLDEQVQEIKSDVLAIAAELSNLEERLLYPSNTQVAVFVELAEGQAEKLSLDSIRVEIDGERAAHHIYSFKELEALGKGGVQRLYTGNVRTGDHRIEVSVAGKSVSGQEFAAVETFTFTKEVDPKLIGITLGSQLSGGASIEFGDW